MENKICVYAICKNEMKFIDRFLDSFKDADYIVVLDTGSTDGSYEKLKADPRVTRVEQEIITPWRFDVARNKSMELIPEDANICFCLDFDEIIEPGWDKVLRENWREDDTRGHYMYAWSHNDLGEPQDIFKYNKIHARHGYHWVFPVHEVIWPIDGDESQEHVFDAGEGVYVHHLQDKEKDRGSYLPLLELCVKEFPEESHSKMMLSREYLIYGDLDKARKSYLECLDYKDIQNPNRIETKLEVLCRLGDVEFLAGNYTEAIKWYSEFIKICNNHREPYFCMAEIYNNMGLYPLAIGMVETALKFSVRFYDWIERKDNWIAKANDLLAVSYYYTRRFDEALENIKIAYEHNPNDPRILKNMNLIMQSKYENAPIKIGEVC